MITISSFNSTQKLLNLNTDIVGGIVYVYIDDRFVKSVTNYQNTNIDLSNYEFHSGDIITVLYFVNGIIESADNFKLIVQPSTNSSNLKKVDLLNYFSDYDISYLEELKDNLLEKIVSKGTILNHYLLEDIDNTDFLEFWTSILKYFLLFKIASKKIVEGLLGSDNNLLSTYLTQRGFFLSGYETNSQLKSIQSHLYQEFSKRGTLYPFTEEGGEFLNLIRYNNYEEFVINLYKDESFGFNVGNSSPLYRGLENELGFLKSNTLDTNNIITISPYLDYRLELVVNGPGTFNFGIESYDIDGNNIGLSKLASSGNNSKYFIQNLTIDEDLVVEGFIYNKDRELSSKHILAIGVGSSLIVNENCFKIKPIIEILSGTINIESFKLTLNSTEYSRGFIQVNNFVSTSFKNNSNYSSFEIDSITEKFLLSYHTHWKSSSTEKNFINILPCQGNEFSNWEKTGKFKCEQIVGSNTGKLLLEESDINNCTNEGQFRWVDGGIDYKKCPNCLPNGVDLFIGSITCDCKSVIIKNFSCGCIDIQIEKISCNC